MITFRNASERELGVILDWAAIEGWNPGLDDAAAFFAADPAGFFLAVDGEEPVGAISVVNHNDGFAFLGLYIVRPDYRGQGIGYGLWQHAIAHAGTRAIGLDGVPDQQANYARSGFRHAGKTMRFSGRVEPKTTASIRLAEASDLTTLIDREAEASGTRKTAYMTAWFSGTANRKTLIHPDGFLTIRKCRDGAKIGPLVAGDITTALQLIRHAAGIFGETVIIDVPDSADALGELCEDLKLTAAFETARMYRGTAPVSAGGHYAVASLELG